MIPLLYVNSGKVKIMDIKGGRGVLRRLAEYGIFIGDEVEVLKGAPGFLQIKKGDSKIALGMGIASKIFVSPVENGYN